MHYTPWTQSRSGVAIDLLSATANQISFYDMAYSLARMFRFNGNTVRDITVARHSVNVAQALRAEGHGPETCLYGLLHDGHEYVVGDITRPAQDLISALYGSFAPFRQHVRRVIDPVIFAKAGLPGEMPAHIRAAVKLADDRMLATEKRDCMAASVREWGDLPPPYPTPLKTSASVLEDQNDFLSALTALMAANAAPPPSKAADQDDIAAILETMAEDLDKVTDGEAD